MVDAKLLISVFTVFAEARCSSVHPSCHVGALYPDGWRYCQTSFSSS